MSLENNVLLGCLWLFYFAMHSVLANDSIKKRIFRRIPQIEIGYRILYNFVAVIFLIPLIYILYFTPSPNIVHWEGFSKQVCNVIAILAMLGFLYSLKFYNMRHFLGFEQLQHRSNENSDTFTISPLHRFVRHPWYSFALIIIWTRDMNVHFLISAVFMTAYFFIDARMEEQKLVKQFGESYQTYMNLVPGIIPSFRRYLTRSQAATFSKKD